MVAAYDITGWLKMPCFSHTLQLAVEAVFKLPEVSRALARYRNVVLFSACLQNQRTHLSKTD